MTLTELMKADAAKILAAIAKLVASAPALTEEQVDRLRPLLSTPAHQAEPDYVAPSDLWKEMDKWTK